MRKITGVLIFLFKLTASLAGMLAAAYAFYLITVMAATGYEQMAAIAAVALCFIMLGISSLWR